MTRVSTLTSVPRRSAITLLALAFILLNLVDILLMQHALRSGIRELNPLARALFGPDLAGIILFRIGGSAFFAWVMCLRRQKRALKIAVVVMTVMSLLNLATLQVVSLA